MEAQGWDQEKATAMKLGNDTGLITTTQTRNFLEQNLFSKPDNLEQFASDMEKFHPFARNKMKNYLDIFFQCLYFD